MAEVPGDRRRHDHWNGKGWERTHKDGTSPETASTSLIPWTVPPIMITSNQGSNLGGTGAGSRLVFIPFIQGGSLNRLETYCNSIGTTAPQIELGIYRSTGTGRDRKPTQLVARTGVLTATQNAWELPLDQTVDVGPGDYVGFWYSAPSGNFQVLAASTTGATITQVDPPNAFRWGIGLQPWSVPGSALTELPVNAPAPTHTFNPTPAFFGRNIDAE